MLLAAVTAAPGGEGCKALLLLLALLLTGWVQQLGSEGAAQHSHDPGGTRLLLV
ncbi:hypothetical protein [Streptomyces sp. NPDC048623]|uniref:hypothetical protein n=1 Tax=Streptomyces sp. NPDC048623 TaxID=3155761 RepID=UPI0034176303